MEPEIQKQEDTENATDSVGGVQPSTAVVMRSKDTEIESGEDVDSNPKIEVRETSEVSSGEEQVGKGLEPERKDCVVNVTSDESLRAEKVCRICHTSSENSSETVELIQLGCGCKEELGVAHRHCAETWFKYKGNRQCEICGKTAKNITGIQDSRIFMLEWNETRLMRNVTNPSDTESSGRCKRSCWNFLLACLVLVFILPWFFRDDIL